MRRLFYDTETTGLPSFGKPSSGEHQPHIVQIAATLVDGDYVTISEIDLIVVPDGWAIPAETTAIHGITQEHAESVGVPEFLAVRILLSLWLVADVRIGHVESFDARILRIGLKRFADDATADRWKEGAAECTARLAGAAMGIKGRRNPTLADAHLALVGTPLQRAHSARGDVDGTIAIYRELTAGRPLHA